VGHVGACELPKSNENRDWWAPWVFNLDDVVFKAQVKFEQRKNKKKKIVKG